MSHVVVKSPLIDLVGVHLSQLLIADIFDLVLDALWPLLIIYWILVDRYFKRHVFLLIYRIIY